MLRVVFFESASESLCYRVSSSQVWNDRELERTRAQNIKAEGLRDRRGNQEQTR